MQKLKNNEARLKFIGSYKKGVYYGARRWLVQGLQSWRFLVRSLVTPTSTSIFF